MPRAGQTSTPTPGQAQYILERLISERRIAATDVSRYVAEMGRKITDIEARRARLREAAGPSHARPAVQRARRTRPARSAAPRTRERGSKRRTGNPLAGRYMGYMRASAHRSEESRIPEDQREARLRARHRRDQAAPWEVGVSLTWDRSGARVRSGEGVLGRGRAAPRGLPCASSRNHLRAALRDGGRRSRAASDGNRTRS